MKSNNFLISEFRYTETIKYFELLFRMEVVSCRVVTGLDLLASGQELEGVSDTAQGTTGRDSCQGLLAGSDLGEVEELAELLAGEEQEEVEEEVEEGAGGSGNFLI